jgi:hypothetical protein
MCGPSSPQTRGSLWFTGSSGLLGLRFDLLKMAFHFEALPFAEPE